MPYDVDIGDGADALGQNQLTDALDGTYWVSGWDATLGTGDLEVDIAAGSGAVAGTDVSTGSTQTIDFTGDPDSTDPRKAVIYVDSGGTVQKSLGTPQPVDPSGEIRFRTYNPSPPASVSGVVVAEVWLAAGETVLESADIRDRRVSNHAASTTPLSPIKKADELITFNEDYISIEGTNVNTNEKIELQDTTTSGNAILYYDTPVDLDSWDISTYQRELDGENVSVDVGEPTDDVSVSLGADDSSAEISNSIGVKINPNVDLSAVHATFSSLTRDFTRLRVYSDAGDVLKTLNVSNKNSGDTVLVNYDFTAGTDYRIECDAGGTENFQVGINSSPSYPFTSSDVDVVAGSQNGSSDSTSNRWSFSSISSVSFSPLNSNTSSLEDISGVSPTTNIAHKVNISRSSTSNNPRLNYLGRRFER